MKKTKKHPPRLAKTIARRSEAGKKIAPKRYLRKIRNAIPLSLGNIAPEQSKILLLVLAIIFFFTVIVFQHDALKNNESKQAETKFAYVPKVNSNAASIKDMVKGYPIEQMIPYIDEQDPKVAAFMVAIAKQESGWGTHKPVLNGQDCYNYWGFRMKTDKMGSGGHTCFDSPQQAVDAVADRISQLINDENINTPNDMVIWKCGYACQDRPKTQGDQQWIRAVSMYYKPLMN